MPEAALPLLKPSQGPKPRLGLDPTKIVLLAMQIGSNVVAHEAKESGDTEGFIAVADDLEIDIVMVEEDAEPCDDGVNGDHPEDTNNAAHGKAIQSAMVKPARIRSKPHSLALLDGFAIVHGMAHDQEYGDAAGEQGTNTAHDEAEAVEGNASIPEIGLLNC